MNSSNSSNNNNNNNILKVLSIAAFIHFCFVLCRPNHFLDRFCKGKNDFPIFGRRALGIIPGGCNDLSLFSLPPIYAAVGAERMGLLQTSTAD